MSALLDAQGLVVGYRQGAAATVLLDGIDFSLRDNEIVVVVGSSGVGKSSLLRILAGLEKALSGRVAYRGEPLNGPHPHLSVAFQDPTLLPWRTLEQNVAFGLNFRHQPRLSAGERRERIAQAIEAVGLQGHAGKLPAQLSGGMAQRAALARCLARRPRVMLLDEPFSSLDEITRHEMQRLLVSVLRRHRMSALMITHDIDEALLIADRVILLGGSPGHVAGSWSLDLPHPRDDALEALARYRLDIVKKLRDSRAIGKTTEVADVSDL
ncbi:ABC transporter ATP-binding protein [Brenneria tiliae]|uniref:ABC transporter ATP-binding protein n=1 Tax=Brenneria tiliae TaxID=2914984 RepID=UPI002014EECF|nr:ATP-binding cassette domain-containing protein [Brenneria tiliae]MCL2896902.1 ATP-binding cassette domain-containing protein [Brenneria tiliae]MCL2901460.1 ATP-binding cassette domain-containing protein [Brenneria tiliae]